MSESSAREIGRRFEPVLASVRVISGVGSIAGSNSAAGAKKQCQTRPGEESWAVRASCVGGRGQPVTSVGAPVDWQHRQPPMRDTTAGPPGLALTAASAATNVTVYFACKSARVDSAGVSFFRVL